MTFEAFRDELANHPETIEAMKNAPQDQWEGILRSAFPEMTDEQWQALPQPAEGGELSDDELSSVSGGITIFDQDWLRRLLKPIHWQHPMFPVVGPDAPVVLPNIIEELSKRLG